MNDLELPLWQTLQAAQQHPEQVDWSALLAQVEAAIAPQSDQSQLHWAGEALLRLTELWVQRSEALLTQWEETHRDPIVASGFFSDIVRQTMAVDFSELMEPSPPRQRRTRPAKVSEPEGSIAAPVDKAAILAMVEQWEQEAAIQQPQIGSIAHAETGAALVGAITAWMQTWSDRVSLAQLCQGLALSRTEVWLGLLWGDFELQQEGEFYSDAIFVRFV